MLDIALMNHRISLIKEWGKVYDEEGRSPVSRDQECEWLDGMAALAAALRDRVLNLTSDGAETQITEAEAKRRTAVAKMIISEIQVGEALHDSSIGPYLGSQKCP